MHAGLGVILVAFLVRLAGDSPARLRKWIDGALAAFLLFAPFLALAWFVGPELPTVGGAILGGTTFALIIRRRTPATDAKEPGGLARLRATLPYFTVIVLVLATRLISPLRETLQLVLWDWTLLDAFTGRIEPLNHPGTLLLVSFVLGGILQGRSLHDIAGASAHAARRLVPVVIALLAMLALSRLMVHAGMIRSLAEAAAAMGLVWPFFAPFIGVLGTFVTGSATFSSILF